MRKLSFILAAVLCFALAQAASAQEITGTLVGTVKDSNGAAVSGATVTITDSNKNNIVVRTITTDESGEFSAPQLPVSTYQVSVEAANFKKFVQTEIKLDVNQRRDVDVTLEAGDVSATVTVQSDPVQVDLNSAASGTLISGNQARETPLNNRNFTQLILLSPGVSNNQDDLLNVGSTNPQTGAVNLLSISVNGARSSSNTYRVDGADTTDRGSNLTIQTYPSIDAIGEFRVLRSLYPAETGGSGGGQVNVITRSGTDKFSGTLYEFVRNEKFNANDVLVNQLTDAQIIAAGLRRGDNGKVTRRPLRYNNFGWTLGGPVYFFNFGERDPNDSFFAKQEKTFFFFSQEFRRDIRYPVFSTTIPSSAVQNGVFPIEICLTYTAGVCTEKSNTIPQNRISPAARAYVQSVLAPLGEPAANFSLASTLRNEVKFRQEMFRLDHQFTENLSAFFRLQNDNIPSIDGNALFSSGSGLANVSTTSTKSPGRTYSARVNYVASPNLIFEGGYAYSYGAILSEVIGALSREVSPNININLPYVPASTRVPSITGGTTGYGFTGLVGFGPYDNFSDNHNINGTATYIFGNHTMKAGGSFGYYRKNENALAGNNEGIFSNFSSVLPTTTPSNTTNLNLQRFANFLQGRAGTFTQSKFDYTADLRARNIEAFVQDEWKFRKNLTLYFGVRYSYFGQPYDKNGRLSNFDPALFDPRFAPNVRGNSDRVLTIPNPTPGGPPLPATNEYGNLPNLCNGIIANAQNLINEYPNCTPIASPFGNKIAKSPKYNFAPRIGLAFDPFGDGLTSIRTGYGIYHEQSLLGIYLQNIGTNPPYQQNLTLTNVSLDNPAASAPTNGGFTVPLATATLRAIQSDWKTPYMQHWSLEVQRQLGDKTVFSIGYFGSKGTNLIGVVDINLLPPGYAISLGANSCATGTSYLGQAGTPTTAACQAPGTFFSSAAQSNILDQIRPFRGYRAINMIQPRFDSNYHSMQISALHRFTEVSQVTLAYTWSKNLTNNQTDRSTAPQNPYDIDSEWGRAQLDRRHILNVNYTYEIPFFAKSENKFVRTVLGGWQSSGIITFQTGIPFTAATSNYDPAGIGFLGTSASGGRPNALGDPNANYPGTQFNYFNGGAFATNPTAGTIVSNTPGSAGRGTINGPNTFRVDFTLFKNFRFGERYRLQIRGEAFNLFNTTNYRTLQTNVTSTQYNQVTAFRDPRSLQFGAKFYF